MAEHVCPWWIGYLLISPLRRLLQNPEKILTPHIRPGMVTLDVGCGMGFFSLDMARMVGPEGKVVCVDLQPRMIKALVRRSTKAGLAGCIDSRTCSKDSLCIDDLNGQIDFAIAFAIVHEVPDPLHFLQQIYRSIKPGGAFLLTEPRGHVTNNKFRDTESTAKDAGFAVVENPPVGKSHAVLLIR